MEVIVELRFSCSPLAFGFPGFSFQGLYCHGLDFYQCNNIHDTGHFQVKVIQEYINSLHSL